MRVFVSYARVDIPFVLRIIDCMDIHDVWYDYRVSAGRKWWEDILKRLDWCERFIFCFSEASINSDYCLKEWAVAQRLGKRVVPVLLAPDLIVPNSLKYPEYVDFSQGLSIKGVKQLLAALGK